MTSSASGYFITNLAGSTQTYDVAITQFPLPSS
jgi:hypothetical protein